MDFLNKIEHDFENVILQSDIDVMQFQNKTFFISGATGLIGTNLVIALLLMSEKYHLDIKVIAFVRNIEKAKKKLGDYYFSENIIFVVGDITEPINYQGEVNYIVHAASQTSSRNFVSNPVETISVAINGTTMLLEMAKNKKVEGFIYLSSMEVYGFPQKGTIIDEECIGDFVPTEIRNCYPLSKIMCENICMSYKEEYNIPIRIIRLTQTFGPGTEYFDSRIFAEFARNIIEKKPIVLKTKGETERCYLYTMDAVMAILYVVIGGKNGQIYNAANNKTYCSIVEMAKLVTRKWNLELVYNFKSKQIGYAKTLYINLDTSKLLNLGWKPHYDLLEMFSGMIEGMFIE